MNNRTKAVLIGGVIAGVLSGLPIIQTCCFLWSILGGFVAVWLYVKDSPGGPPITMGDAAKLGAIAGAIGAVISVVLGVPFLLLQIGLSHGDSGLGRLGGAAAGFGGLLIRAGLVVGFAAVGGLIGAAVFGKQGPPGATPPPPPPPGGGYGGPTGGGFGGGQPGGGSYGGPEGGGGYGGPQGGGYGGPAGGGSYGQGS